MNDDKKSPNSTPSASGGGAGPSADPQENPWDEDSGAGRTLAMASPSFELPSNIPSPITAPPPALVPELPPKRKPAATMIGFGPPGPALPGGSSLGAPPAVKALATAAMPFAPMPAVNVPSVPDSAAELSAAAAAAKPPSSGGLRGQAPGSRAGGPPPSARGVPPRPGVAPPSARPGSSPSASSRALKPAQPQPAQVLPTPMRAPQSSQQEDSPTMAVPSPILEVLAGRPIRDDAPFGFEEEGESEETTRAVSREEMMGLGHQDAHVVVGAGAFGEDATLALAPGQVSLGIGDAIAAELAASVTGGEGPRQSAPAFPGFPEPHHQPFQTHPTFDAHESPAHLPASQPYGMGMPQQPPASWQGEAAQSYRNPPMGAPMGAPPMGGYDASHPSHNSQGHPQSSPHIAAHGQYPQSGQHPMAPPAYPHPQSGGGFGSNPNMQVAQPYPPNAMQPMQGQMQGAPQNWGPPQGPQGKPASKLTPQIIGLVAVGIICLAIFVVGIVLFVTSRS